MQGMNQKFFKDLQTFTPEESVIALRDSIPETNRTQYSNWFVKGVSCKVLTPGGKWQTGTVKIGLIFCPDLVEAEKSTPEPESAEPETKEESEAKEEEIVYPLDEIRRTLNSDETP